jgi:phosphoglycolate phosphatase-like HAD superfamily hydrolase
VGDMTHDIDAGKKAKVITIAVSWGYQPKEKLTEENPNFLIEDLEELKRIIESAN